MSNLLQKPWLWLSLVVVCLLGFSSRFWNYVASPNMTPAEQSALQMLEQVCPIGYRQSRHGAVVELSISSPDFSTEHASHLAAFPMLKTLHLENSGIGDEALSALRNLTQLENLHVDGTSIGDSGLDNLIDLHENLRHLSLIGCNITDDGLNALGALKTLTILNLSQTKITDAGLKSLKGLLQLEVLFLRDLPLTGAGLVNIGQLPSLVKLDLSRTQLASEHVAGLANFPQLEQLFLSGCPVDDPMIAVLLEELLRSNNRLRALTISQVPLTDAAIEPLESLARLPQLSLVQMQQTAITLNAFRKLAERAPEINFSVDYPIE